MSAEPATVPRTGPSDTPLRAVGVTLAVCVLCSAAIAATVSWLRPYQQAHREAERWSRIHELVASVVGVSLGRTAQDGAWLTPRVVELASGDYAELDPEDFEADAAVRDPAASVGLPPESDPAGVGRRARHATVFEVRDADGLQLVVLPVHGAGYLSVLRGHVALGSDAAHVRGLVFHEQGETPGLGSEIESPQWQQLWVGKRVRDDAGQVRLGVARGRVAPGSAEAPYLVDGITGATKTGDGVTALLRFWLGPDGFGPYLERLAREQAEPE